ncbi:uncharacterized protein UV8b_07315 [Ustilaginoidea virens]|uniref:Uncharacterized protein n=1 Tax=Ustilaginoidea virens TaxID=1159556 RepID=A0A8E5HWU2_USTVR|nr:uncharacterized protein UV8b_07315 [Ustilaginoidea virens]QUC23074.1 hypothetical protein UV8b_07315 [Ustilaginoidea virens]
MPGQLRAAARFIRQTPLDSEAAEHEYETIEDCLPSQGGGTYSISGDNHNYCLPILLCIVVQPNVVAT